MSKKEMYRRLCAQEDSIPLFSQDWWLDAVCGAPNWDVGLVTQGDKIVATMPYSIRRVAIFRVITMPLLTQTMGPWIRYPDGIKYANRLGHEKEVMNKLIDQLPKYDHFSQNFRPSVTNWLPFYWHGFRQTTRYTYAINDLTDLDKVYSDFASSLRNKIKKAQKVITVSEDGSLDELHRLITISYERRNFKNPYSIDLVRRIDAECTKKQCRRILFGRDSHGNTHCALYLVYDRNRAYRLLTGFDPRFGDSGAISLVGWESIKIASQVTKIYDFEGSMLEGVETRNRAFGAIQTPYFTVSKTPSRLYRMASVLRGQA